jgi:tetratricopeptide (TPR) repeat protein
VDEQHSDSPQHDEVIKPAKLGLKAAEAAPAAPPLRERRTLWSILLAGGVLVVLVVGVFFVLPGWVADRNPQPQTAVVVEPELAAPEESSEPELTAEELERLREQAEALLAELLTQQARLEELSASSWGAEQWQSYADLARNGDDAYLANAFQDAVPAYTQALEVGAALLERSTDIIDSSLRAGNAALEAGNAALAQEQFQLVIGIEPEHEAAQRGLARAERLPEVLALTQHGQTAERDGALDSAAARYREALAIDTAWAPARVALTRVEARLRGQRFDALMSQAYSALAEEQFDDAHEYFSGALLLRPDAQEAADGKLQAEQGLRLDQIALLEARALAFERRELWPQAIEQFKRALETDANLVFAQEGLERAQRRADLDTKLSHLLANPNLLFDDRILADTQSLLAAAEAIPEPGQRLTEQTEQLGRLLRLASTPVSIEFVSDSLTEVTVYRVGQLGTFAQTTVELRPGNYTAIGSRDGYRDVRETFTVLPGRSLAPIRVVCVERI